MIAAMISEAYVFYVLHHPAVKEKRGHRESRLLGNINKMLLETSEQMQLPNIEAMAQQLSEVNKRCKSSTWIQVLDLELIDFESDT